MTNEVPQMSHGGAECQVGPKVARAPEVIFLKSLVKNSLFFDLKDLQNVISFML